MTHSLVANVDDAIAAVGDLLAEQSEQIVPQSLRFLAGLRRLINCNSMLPFARHVGRRYRRRDHLKPPARDLDNPTHKDVIPHG